MMHQPICTCEQPLCPADTGGFYVTVRDHDRTGWLLGPYQTHEDALANEPRARRLAADADPKAPWYAYGTARVKFGPLPVSVFGR